MARGFADEKSDGKQLKGDFHSARQKEKVFVSALDERLVFKGEGKGRGDGRCGRNRRGRVERGGGMYRGEREGEEWRGEVE